MFFRAFIILSLSFFGYAETSWVTLESRGNWQTHPPASAESVILIPQWHVASPQTKELTPDLPQYKNQEAIYQQLKQWVEAKNIKSLVVEGCEQDLSEVSKLQTHVGVRLANQFNEFDVLCGDNLQLIKENQLALSDIRGLVGFRSRLTDKNLSPTNRKLFLSGAKKVLKLDEMTSEDEVFKKIDLDLQASIGHFENLIKARNDSFLKKVKAIQGIRVVVIGALHIDDLKSKLEKENIPCAIWKPVGLQNGEENLIRDLKNLLIKTAINPADVFEKFWQTGKANIYPLALAKKFFNQQQYKILKKKAEAAGNLRELATHLNEFLAKLKVSHTHFYTDADLDFYFFRSLFTTRKPQEPKIWHIGAEYQTAPQGFVIRSVLDGFPAQGAGIKRGDIILLADQKPFDPVFSFHNKARVLLKFLRNNRTMEISVEPVIGGLQQSYIESITNSVSTTTVANKKLAYIHLWTGTDTSTVEELAKAVEKNKDADGLILDLRNGYGGAWWDHLNPFYADSASYFKATWVERGGKRTDTFAEKTKNPDFFKKPMVVLINEGVRSGKEALAFQFKKTKRATLVGTTTAGFFVAGGAYFREPELPYFLYLSSKGLLLDGVDIEGKGVKPDIEVKWPLNQSLEQDPQLEKAKSVLLKKLGS